MKLNLTRTWLKIETQQWEMAVDTDLSPPFRAATQNLPSFFFFLNTSRQVTTSVKILRIELQATIQKSVSGPDRKESDERYQMLSDGSDYYIIQTISKCFSSFS